MTTIRPSLDVESVASSVAHGAWDYADAKTQDLTHGIHRYSGKFIPQVAARAIGTLTDPGELVLDPYSGSGTTLLEAARMGRRAIGLDANPLAVLIATAKITPIPTDRLRTMRRSMATSLQHLLDMPLFGADSSRRSKTELDQDPRLSDAWYTKWFQPHVLEELVAIDHAIRDIDDEHCKRVALVAFSEILRRSSNAHSGYPNVMFHREAPKRSRPAAPFLKSLDRICSQVESLSSVDARWQDVVASRGFAEDIPLASESIDAVVSHPPYIGSVPYAEYGALSLVWLGHDPKALDRELTGGRRQSSDVVDRFRKGYLGMLRESCRVLRQGRYLFVLVGNPVVKREVIDLSAMTIALADEAGLCVAARAERSGVNRRANKMGSEHIIVLRKS